MPTEEQLRLNATIDTGQLSRAIAETDARIAALNQRVDINTAPARASLAALRADLEQTLALIATLNAAQLAPGRPAVAAPPPANRTG